MKKSIFMFATATILTAATSFTACTSPEKKVDNAENKVQDAKDNLKEVKQDANAADQKLAEAEQWKVFRGESEVKIKENDLAIVKMKEEAKLSKKKMDATYTRSIDTLQMKNKALTDRLSGYDKTAMDWDTFKREFNRDMDSFGEYMKNLVSRNKK
jgi:hypothetical protein